MAQNIFNLQKEVREARCKRKDAIIGKILGSLQIDNPRDFHALLMPCLHGPEVDFLLSRGVPGANIWAIERERGTWEAMRANLPVRMLTEPMSSSASMPHIHAINPETRFDLVYLDYFGQPGAEHIAALRYLFMLRLLQPTATLILTFSANRCSQYSVSVNRSLRRSEGDISDTVKLYVDNVLSECRKLNSDIAAYRSCDLHSYPSSVGRGRYGTCRFDW